MVSIGRGELTSQEVMGTRGRSLETRARAPRLRGLREARGTASNSLQVLGGRKAGARSRLTLGGGGVSDPNTNTLGIPREGGPMPPHHSPPLDPAAHLAPSARAQCEATLPQGNCRGRKGPACYNGRGEATSLRVSWCETGWRPQRGR